MEGRLSKGIRLLSKLSKTRVVAADLDGTLTSDRKSFEIPLDVIESVRKLRKDGVKVFIVSANAFPVLAGLSRYLGFDGFVAENGCLISLNTGGSIEVIKKCSTSARGLVGEILSSLGDRLVSSWQNRYRDCDFALVTKGREKPSEELVGSVRRIVEKTEYKGLVRVSSSGYAIHLTPVECSKLDGLKTLLNLVGLGLEDTVGIGDSVMDVEFVRECGVSVAVSNADDELKDVADIITEKWSGYGFAELAKLIIDSRNIDFRGS
jgi:phosphoglycolate phosphatase (TIGR01487 family)